MILEGKILGLKVQSSMKYSFIQIHPFAKLMQDRIHIKCMVSILKAARRRMFEQWISSLSKFPSLELFSALIGWMIFYITQVVTTNKVNWRQWLLPFINNIISKVVDKTFLSLLFYSFECSFAFGSVKKTKSIKLIKIWEI